MMSNTILTFALVLVLLCINQSQIINNQLFIRFVLITAFIRHVYQKCLATYFPCMSMHLFQSNDLIRKKIKCYVPRQYVYDTRIAWKMKKMLSSSLCSVRLHNNTVCKCMAAMLLRSGLFLIQFLFMLRFL